MFHESYVEYDIHVHVSIQVKLLEYTKMSKSAFQISTSSYKAIKPQVSWKSL